MSGGTHAISAPAPGYQARTPAEALDFLAGGAFSIGAASFYMRTWEAGLAYGNGTGLNPHHGRMSYYADRCPDPVQLMRFVAGLAKTTPVDSAVLEASLANAFQDERVTASFSVRGAALAEDLVDGLTPDVVRSFKHLLLQTAHAPNALAAFRDRVTAVLGRMLVGVNGRVSQTPGTLALLAGPGAIVDKYEQFLRDSGEISTLPRIYPRDFWPPESATRNRD
jgi:SAM-dependent methyltransferase